MRRLIIGFDGSGPSRSALSWALKRADRDQFPVVIASVADEEWGQLGTDYAHEQTRKAAELLHDAAVEAGASHPALSVETRLLHGSPVRALTDLCTPEDLIVVGTHKTGYLRGRVLGTMSIVVSATADCDVAVIPHEDFAGRRGVVIGVAPGQAAAAAVVAGAIEAAKDNHELTLVRADERGRSAFSTQLLADAVAQAAEAASNLVIRSRFSQRHPADALLDASRSAALLVLGASRVPPENAAFIGSLCHEVLLNINSPVLVVRT